MNLNYLLFSFALNLLNFDNVLAKESYQKGVPSNIPTHQPWLWPLPQSWSMGEKTLGFDHLNIEYELPFESDILDSALNRYTEIFTNTPPSNPMVPYNWTSTSKDVKGHVAGIFFDIKNDSIELGLETDESYCLEVTANHRIKLEANNVFGALRGLETLSQLIRYSPVHSQFVIPHAPWKINDYPTFKHRGLLLDTSRHYYPLSDIFKVLDGMSYNKLNVFHWHMLDATSFAYQSKSYPQLTEFGSYGPEYTYGDEEIQSVVQYALERGIRVLPEIEAPGHATSWGLGMPEIGSCIDRQPHFGFTVQPPAGQLNPTNPKSLQVIDSIVDEWDPLFPDHYFHASGDEIVMKCWTEDPQISEWLKSHNMTSFQLLDQFVSKMHQKIRSYGRSVIVWQEMLLEYNATLPLDTIVQPWFGPTAVKEIVSKGYRTIVSTSEYWYLDVGFGRPRSNPYPQDAGSGYNHWNRIYSYDITEGLTTEETKLVLGGEIALWGELVDSNNFETMLWPRASAAAERLWSGYRTNEGKNLTSADAILRLIPWRETMVQRGIRATPLNQGYCSRNPLSCFQPPKKV